MTSVEANAMLAHCACRAGMGRKASRSMYTLLPPVLLAVHVCAMKEKGRLKSLVYYFTS